MTVMVSSVPPLHGPLKRGSVKKHVAAIHVSGKLTLLQRKLSNVLLLNAYDGLLTKRSHSIDMRTLSAMIGYDSNDIATLKDALRALAETVAEWDMLGDDGRQEWGVSALLSYAKLKGGVCEYAYSPALAEKLYDPKIFSLINLSVQRNFSSGHALALYENCYRFIGTGSTGWWEIGLFRRLMGLDESAYYENFKHLNAKIIKPGVAEVNRVSNISLTPDFARQARRVVSVRFLVTPSAQTTMFDLGDDEGARQTRIYEALTGQGISDRLARQWIREYGEAYVAEKIAYVEEQRRRGRLRDGGASYLSAAIRDNYRRGPQTKAAPRTVGAEQRRVIRLAESRNPTQRDADRRQFLASIRDEADREDFRRNGWASLRNAPAILSFWTPLLEIDGPAARQTGAEAVSGSAWSAVRARLAAENPAVFRAWLEQLNEREGRADRIVLAAPSRFVAEYVARNLRDDLIERLREHGIIDLEIRAD